RQPSPRPLQGRGDPHPSRSEGGMVPERDAVAMNTSSKKRSHMSVSKCRNRSLLALLALAATAIFLLPASQASAATYNNACVNSLITNQSSLIPVTLTGETSTGGPVKAGDSITLEEIEEELAVPSAVFLAGYRAGVLHTGLNKIPTDLNTLIRGT